MNSCNLDDASEAASLGPELNWLRQKSKLWAAGGGMNHWRHSSREGGCSSWVEEFVHLGCHVHSTTQSWYLTSQCHLSCSYAKPRQSDLEVKNLRLQAV